MREELLETTSIHVTIHLVHFLASEIPELRYLDGTQQLTCESSRYKRTYYKCIEFVCRTGPKKTKTHVWDFQPPHLPSHHINRDCFWKRLVGDIPFCHDFKCFGVHTHSLHRRDPNCQLVFHTTRKCQPPGQVRKVPILHPGSQAWIFLPHGR